MTAEQYANYILDHRDEARERFADGIAKFEALGIDHTTAEAMTYTLLANVMALLDELKRQ